MSLWPSVSGAMAKKRAAVANSSRAKPTRSDRMGTRSSSDVPTVTPTEAPAKISRPGAQATEPSSRNPPRAEAEMSTMAPSEVPWARRCSMPNSSTRQGTMRIPPPTPNSPDRKPVATPTPIGPHLELFMRWPPRPHFDLFMTWR